MRLSTTKEKAGEQQLPSSTRAPDSEQFSILPFYYYVVSGLNVNISIRLCKKPRLADNTSASQSLDVRVLGVVCLLHFEENDLRI